MYSSQQFWDERWEQVTEKQLYKQEGHSLCYQFQHDKPQPEWLCSYQTLLSLYEPFLKKKLCCALILGAGLHPFPEQLYDSGIREVVVADVSQVAMDVMKDRQDPDKGGLSRTGLRFLHADVALLDQACLASDPGSSIKFDLVIDKGTLDCIVSGENGQQRASSAVQSVYNLMKTPATWVMVSHSPPCDRLELLNSVYWHEIKVQRVQATPFDKLSSDEPYKESLVDVDVSQERKEYPAFEAGSAYVYTLVK